MLPAAGNTAVATLDAIVLLLLLFWFWLEFGNTAVVAGEAPPGGDGSCWPAVTDCAEVLETFVQVEEGVVVLVPTRLLLLLLTAAATCATAGPGTHGLLRAFGFFAFALLFGFASGSSSCSSSSTCIVLIG